MNILTFFAHPDDETMLCGGTLALLAQSGFKLHYYCATRGEGGEVGVPPLCTVEQLGEVREAELVCAVQALGAASLTFLGYVDPRVGPNDELFAFTDNLTLLAGQVAASIRQHEPVAIITHGSNGEYGHPAHRLMHQAVMVAAASFAPQAPAVYTVQAAYPEHPRPKLMNPLDPAHMVLDISPVLAKKQQAALCHRTQHDLFVRTTSQEAGHPVSVTEAVMTIESLHRALPPTPATVWPDDALSQALRRSGCVPFGQKR